MFAPHELDPWILSGSGGEWDLRALLRPDFCLWWNCCPGLPRKRKPGTDSDLHWDGLAWRKGVPSCPRGEREQLQAWCGRVPPCVGNAAFFVQGCYSTLV